MTARFVQSYNGHCVQPYRDFKREAEADSEADSEADAEASPESWYNGVYSHPHQHQGFYNEYTYGQRSFYCQRFPHMCAYSTYPTTTYSRYPTTTYSRYPASPLSRFALV